MSQTISTLNPATYAFTTNKTEYATKTSTIPSPLGKKLNISADVISKFYMRDALYQKIDNVKEFTFTQDVKLTKHSILQQFNENDVVTAFGTIVDVPNADSLSNPGLGTKYKVGKVFGTFNNTDRYKTDIGDVNQIAGTYFSVEEPEIPWAAGVAVVTGEKKYYDKKIYESQGTGTTGTIAPTHTGGVVSDGVINWAFVDDAGKFTVDLTQHPYPMPQYLESDMPEWDSGKLYVVGQRVWHKLNVYEVASGGAGVSGTTAPVHTTGSDTDGGVTWDWVSTSTPISDFARTLPYDLGNNYTVQIVEIQPGSLYIPEDVVSVSSVNITEACLLYTSPSPRDATLSRMPGCG